MKGIGFKIMSVSAAFCILLSACNFNINGGKELAEVRVGSAGPQRAADPSTGLPAFDGSNTTITITDASGRILDEGPIPFSTGVTIGLEIVIRATVRTASGTWIKTKSHTVKPGINDIDLELSKTPKVAANLLFSITGKHLSGSNIVSLSTQNGKKLLDGILIGKKPVTARDQIGRIYVLYEDTSSTHLKRFDVEGNEDTDFETKLTDALPSGTIGYIDNIAIDIDDNYIFLFKQNTVYCCKEKEDHSFQFFSYDSFPTAPALSASAVAVYDDVLFAVYNDTLFACGFEFEDLLTPGNKRLKFESQATRNLLDKLRTGVAFGNNRTECTGLVVDENHVYCLLKEQGLHHGKLYALGQLVHYTYSGSTFTEKTKIGLNPAASTADPIAFNAQYFSNPIGFIGYDEENIYIADDGVNIGYINENWRIKGNKNRIAAFKRNTNAITFEDTAATWYEQKPEYKKPDTKVLLWENNIHGMLYWTSTDGTEEHTTTNELFADSSSVKPTDVFCYDQDGNLYILWKDDSSSPNHNVRRFVLKDGVSYDSTGADLNNSLGTHPVSAIAVDISDGQNFLYYAYEDGPHKHIQRYSWAGTSFSTAAVDSTYGVHINSQDISFTALAANKDGVFVAVQEKYKDGTIDKYRLKVQKYAKTGSPTAPDSEITLVDDAVSYTDVSDPPNPIADPNPGHDPNAPCHQYQETINGLQIGNGRLYGISSKLHRKWIQYSGSYFTDVFKHSSILYEIGDTAKALPNEPSLIKEKPVDDENKVGYGFYRFIAVKYDEAERIKFIIASDSAWGDGVSSWNGDNSDNIVEFSLKDMLFKEDKQSGGGFSKTFNSSGFAWY